MLDRHRDCKTPGQLIRALLEEYVWSQRVLAIILDVDETGVNKLVTDTQPVTAEIAVVLGELFNLPAERFLDLQKSYDLAKAKFAARPDPGRTTRAHLFGGLPITEMIKRRWIEAKHIKDVSAVESSLAQFFGVSSPHEIEILPHATKKTFVSSPASPSQLAWIYRVRQIASEMIVPRYSKVALKGSIKKLHALLSAPEEARKVPRILAETGVRFVIVESLSSAKIDGVCFWLDKRYPVVGMSLRYDRIDNFWFVLRHELEHVLREHGQTEIALDAELEGARAGTGPDVSKEERIANKAASEFCVPSERMDSFVARKAPFFSQRDLFGFATTLGVHPGLVAGQLQHRTGRYDLFRNYLSKIKFAVAPSAMVDGWGDVVPVDM